MEDILPFSTWRNAHSVIGSNCNTGPVDLSDPRLQERRHRCKVSFGCSEVSFISDHFLPGSPQTVVNSVSLCPPALELSPTQRGSGWAWRWCTGRPTALSCWRATVHSRPLRPVSPAHGLAWSCRVGCSWVCASADEWKRVWSLVLCFSDDAEGEATYYRRWRRRRPNRHHCCKLVSVAVTMFAL